MRALGLVLVRSLTRVLADITLGMMIAAVTTRLPEVMLSWMSLRVTPPPMCCARLVLKSC